MMSLEVLSAVNNEIAREAARKGLVPYVPCGSGEVETRFVHTQPHAPDEWAPQTCTAVLNLNGRVLEGYAAFDGGGHKFTWRLREPREAEEKALPK
jgi:hypothetical protein